MSCTRRPLVLKLRDLLLDLSSELQRVIDVLERLRRTSRAAKDDASISEEPADYGLIRAYALNFGQEHFCGFAVNNSGFENHALVGDGKLRGPAFDGSFKEWDRAYQDQANAGRGEYGVPFRPERVPESHNAKDSENRGYGKRAE
jgi:hypothetical protein